MGNCVNKIINVCLCIIDYPYIPQQAYTYHRVEDDNDAERQ